MSEEVLLGLHAKELSVRSGLRSKWQPLGENGCRPVDVRVTKRSAEAFFLLVTALADEDDEENVTYSPPETNDYLLCLKITEHLDYTVGGATFHYFGVDPTTEYGLRFRSQDDAVEFSKRIIEVKTGLLKASKKREKSARRRQRQKIQQIEKIIEEEVESTVTTQPVVQENGGQNEPYVIFYPGDPTTKEETEAALLKKKAAEKKQAMGQDAYPYATIDEDEQTSPADVKDIVSGDRHFPVARPGRPLADTVVTTQPVRETCGSSSSEFCTTSTTVPRTAAGQAPATKPRSEVSIQPQHRKLTRQHHHNAPQAVHMSNKKELEEHQLWITRQEKELRYYEERNQQRRKQEEKERQIQRRQEEQLKFYKDRRMEERILEPQSQSPQQEEQEHQGRHEQLERQQQQEQQKEDPFVTHLQPMPQVSDDVNEKQGTKSSSPVLDSSRRSKVSTLTELGTLCNEESRRERSSRDSLQKAPVTTQPTRADRQCLKCQHCGKCYYEEENRVGDCKEGPSTCKSIVNVVSCLSLADCLTYCLASDEENEYVFPFQCSAGNEEDRMCCRRWTVLCAAGICCPCLFCYWPLQGCLNVGSSLHVCGAAHKADR